MKEAANRTRGGLMAAWRELVPVAVNAACASQHTSPLYTVQCLPMQFVSP
jgi:hypothetical protein